MSCVTDYNDTDLSADARMFDESRISGLLDRLHQSLLVMQTGKFPAELPAVMAKDISDTVEELEIMDIRLTK